LDYDNGQVRAKGKRHVYLLEINEDILDMYDETHSDHEPFDIDISVETMQAYAANYCTNSNGSDNNIHV
jgi:hypothetical protein